jgi:hypothetical protein
MAESIIAELHGRLLRGIAGETAVHYQGLRAAASHLRRTGLLDSRLAKKLAAVDVAFAISRHITVVSAEQCVSEVLSAIAYEVKAAAERKATEEAYLDQVVNEEVTVDKLAEDEAATKEKHDLEQAATKKAAEEKVEQVAKEKLAVEKAAEQKAAEEVAAKNFLEQVAKAEAAEKVKADAELAAQVKFAEEQSARELAAERKAELEAAIGKVAGRVGLLLPAPEFLALVAVEREAAQLAKAKTAAAKEETLLEQVEEDNSKQAGRKAEKVKPVGTTVTEEAAEVQHGGFAPELATGEKAAKKPKVGKFAKADMELEALAYRIDSMPSAAEELRWRRSGWR